MGILDDTWKTKHASHFTYFNVATLHRFLPPQKLFVSISDRHRPKKRRDAKFARMARVFVPKRGFVTCDCETAEEAIKVLKRTWLGWAQIGMELLVVGNHF